MNLPFHWNFDIQFRRSLDETRWQKPYRIRIVTNKNERSNFRVVAYGDTLAEAIADAQRALADGWSP